ncbi:MAG: signal peptidase II [Candidatus Ancaeobacter aquaticus]|nr:signal peptidase II [Candidatus Ancaeobacter aquaticus]
MNEKSLKMHNFSARRIYIIVLCVLFLDQLSKYFANKYLILHKSVSLIDGFFDITLIHNTGAAFGILIEHTILLICISVVSLIVLIIVGLSSMGRDPYVNTALGLICGGAAGNLIDRIFHGFVIDFLDFHIHNYHWPAFNLADSSICIGTVFLLWYFVTNK